MNVRTLTLVSTVLAATMLAACGGGGGASGSLPPSTGGGSGGNPSQSTQSQTEDSINTANNVGGPLKEFNDYNESSSSPAQQHARQGQIVRLTTNGQCSNGVEFFAPDKQGQPNSTERVVFYDNGCTQPATDAVRVYTSTGQNSEDVARTVTFYAQNSSSPIGVRSETVNFSNASFDQFGYPIAANGFDRTHTGELDINGAKTIDGDGELVVLAAQNTISTFCSDSAGFNATGNQQLSETFGWAGVTPTGTRTVNSDGSITWAASPQGTAYTGPIGGLSINAGVQNTNCPLSTPMFTLAGGTAKGTYTLPMSATFSNGLLTNLTISNAILANGDNLNVQTNNVSPTASNFIAGTLDNSGNNLVATFDVDAFGNGTLTVASTGHVYTITDWHVVK